MKLSAHSHCRNWLASATSSIGSGGGLEEKVLIASSTRARMARQSVTQTRTSLNVLVRPSISLCGRPRHPGGRCGGESGFRARPLLPRGSASPWKRSSLPCTSRSTAMIGWTTSVTSIPCSASSARMELNRKGMLSLRISSTEISRPSGIIGLMTRISALPAVRCCTCSQACSARKARDRAS